MNLSITRGALVFLIIAWIVWYWVFVSVYPEKFKNLEIDNPTIGSVNSSFREAYSYITWKSIELWNKSKELYDKNITPTVNDATNEIKNTVDETKWKIDNVRKTLSWAEETIDKAWKVIEEWKATVNDATAVFKDVKKMNKEIIWTVNKDVVQ